MTRTIFACAFLATLLCSAPVPTFQHAAAFNPAPEAIAPFVSAAPVPALAFGPAALPLSPAATSPLPEPAATCSQHVCNLCVQSGGYCTNIPYCHCVD